VQKVNEEIESFAAAFGHVRVRRGPIKAVGLRLHVSVAAGIGGISVRPLTKAFASRKRQVSTINETRSPRTSTFPKFSRRVGPTSGRHSVDIRTRDKLIGSETISATFTTLCFLLTSRVFRLFRTFYDIPRAGTEISQVHHNDYFVFILFDVKTNYV